MTIGDGFELFVLVLLGWTQNNLCSSAILLPGIDFMELGYDVIVGNPHSDYSDRGFRGAVKKLTFTSKKLSKDGKYFIPDNMIFSEHSKCSYETISYEVTTDAQYVNSLSVDAVVYDREVARDRFTANDQYKIISDGISKYNRSYVETVAMCACYKLQVRDVPQLVVTDEFRDAVKALPIKEGRESYFQFISKFGTHFPQQVTVGAKVVVRSEFQSDVWKELKGVKFNFKTAAGLSFEHATSGSNVSVQFNTVDMKTQEEFDRKRSASVSFFLGPKPSSGGNVASWAQETCANPYPVLLVLQPISKLFTASYIKEASQPSKVVATKRRLFLDALNWYSEYLEQNPSFGTSGFSQSDHHGYCTSVFISIAVLYCNLIKNNNSDNKC